MPKQDITPIVASIVATFENALAVFKRIQHVNINPDSKPKRAHKKNIDVNRNGHDTDRLRLSLQTGPESIMSEYDKNARILGSRYKRGDDIARYSLAHTLLALDTGLTQILSSIMSNDISLGNELARHSLLSLSEKSAADAVSSLSELRQRIAASSTGIPQSPSSVRVASSHHHHHHHHRHRHRHRHHHGVDGNGVDRNIIEPEEKQQEHHHAKCEKKHEMKVAGEDDNMGNPKTWRMEAKKANNKATKQKNIPSHREPVRAILVRSKKDSSVSLISVSGGKYRIKSRPVQTGAAQKRHRSRSRVDSAQHLQPGSVASSLESLSVSSAPPYVHTPLTSIMEQEQQQRHQHQHQQTAGRQTGLEQHRNEQRKEQTYNFDEALPQQVKAPVVPETRMNNRFSIMSFESGSTKIGEIPQHKWLVPPLQGDPAAIGNNWDEANAYESGAVGQKRKPKTGLKFWKRFGKNSNNNNGRWL